MNRSSIWLNITGVICYLMGISFLSTLLLIPVAIYSFIAGAKYFAWAKLNDVELYGQKESLKNWAIFVSIAGFPLGLFSVIPYFLTGNRPVVSNVKEHKPETKETEINGIKGEQEEPKSEHKNSTSKEETINKLKKFKDDGLITEAEYKKAISELDKE